MPDSVGSTRSPRRDRTAGLEAAALTVDGARPTDAAGWLDALRELAGRGDDLLAREATLRPVRRRPRRGPRPDDGGLAVFPRHDGGPRGPRSGPANALFDLAA